MRQNALAVLDAFTAVLKAHTRKLDEGVHSAALRLRCTAHPIKLNRWAWGAGAPERAGGAGRVHGRAEGAHAQVTYHKT